MKIHAYVLAADPTWLRSSVAAYYAHVDKIVVSYDEDGRGWTGAPVAVGRCLAVLRQIDVDQKIEWQPGRFSQGGVSGCRGPGASDTRQRQAALAAAGPGADWVLQIDTDEVLPAWDALLRVLQLAEYRELPAVEWPMRVLYRRLRRGSLLAIAAADGAPHYEYPGPIAIRPNTRLEDCRRGPGSILRPLVIGDRSSLQVQRPPAPREHRVELIAPEEAIWHNSWARSPAATRRKIASWSHNQGARSWLYYYTKWLPAPITWRTLRRLHPLYPPLWPRLEVRPPLPFEDGPDDD